MHWIRVEDFPKFAKETRHLSGYSKWCIYRLEGGHHHVRFEKLPYGQNGCCLYDYIVFEYEVDVIHFKLKWG